MSPFVEVAALRVELGTPDRAGRVPGLGFGARPTQLFPLSKSRASRGSRYSTYEHGGSSSGAHMRHDSKRRRFGCASERLKNEMPS